MAPASRGSIATQVHDFVVLPLRFAQSTSPFSNSKKRTSSTHYLYLRANAPRAPTENTPRELFLVNIPIDATDVHLRSLFAQQLGGARVEDVEFEDARVGRGIKAPVVRGIEKGKKGRKRKRDYEDEGAATQDGEEVGMLPATWDRKLHRSGGTAVVRFVDRASADMALREAKRAVKTSRELIWGAGVEDRVPSLGSARYLAHHRLRYPEPAVLQAGVDAFMAAFTAREEQRAQQLARQRSVPDADGFVTVTRGGRNGPAREEETRSKEEELKKREKNRVKDDFYRFQVREKRKEQAQDLVKSFEEDRKRVEEMRKRRGRLRPE